VCVSCSAQTGHATSAAVWHLGLEMPSAAIPPNSYSSSQQLAQLLSGVVNQRQRQTNKTDPTDRRRTVHNALQQPTLKRTLLHCASSPTIHTHTHPFNGPLYGTTQVSRYQKGTRDSEWQWRQLGHYASLHLAPDR